jgi:hypothetical protein
MMFSCFGQRATGKSCIRTKVENFFDDAEVQERYYAEIIELVKAKTGAVDVQVFDHTVRAAKERAVASQYTGCTMTTPSSRSRSE